MKPRKLPALRLSRSIAPVETLESRLMFNAAVTNALAKIGPALASAFVEYATLKSHRQISSPAAFRSSNSLLPSDSRGLQIEAYASKRYNGQTLATALRLLGASNVIRSGTEVSAILPVDKLAILNAQPSLQFARPAWVVTSGGLVTNQSDIAALANTARSTFGLTGSGVKVGILSDSFNTSAFSDKYANDVSSGDLPAGVQILSDYSGSIGHNDEGRAMAQIIYDMAPGVSLAFATAYDTQATFAANIRALRDAGCKVIVDDVTYLAEPMFQDGVIAQAIDDVVSTGVSYFSAAGNYARKAYESVWRNGVVRGAGSVPAAAGYTFLGGTSFDFDPSAGVNDKQAFTLSANAAILVSLQWDSPYLSANGVKGATSDVDVYILNTAGTIVGSSTTANIGNDPTEVFQFKNTTGITASFTMMVVYRSAVSSTAPTYLKYLDFNNQASGWQFTTSSGSAYGHSNAAGAESVGAARYSQTPAYGVSPAVLESYSSAGTTPIFYDTAGNRLATTITRQTPDIVAPDGGDTTFFNLSGDTDGTGYPNFFGTSAAAPAAAAVGALLLQKNPSLTPTQVYSALETTATDMGTAGYDNDTGWGLINAYNAVLSLTGTVSGTVFQDNNANSTVQAGESGLAGITVFADTNNNGTLDSGETSATTAADGTFSLTALNAGSTVIREIAPDGYVAVTGSKTVTVVANSTASGNLLSLFPVTYTGTASNDSYTLLVDATTTANFDVLISNVLAYTAPKSLVTLLTFNLGGGDDLLTVNYANGNPVPTDGVTYDGGTDGTSVGDALLANGSASADTITINNLFANPGNGSISLNNVESDTINGNGGNDAITVGQQTTATTTIDGGTGTNTLNFNASNAANTVTINTAQIMNGTVPVNFSNVQILNAFTLNGADTINVNIGSGAPATMSVDAGTEDDIINLNTGNAGTALTVLGNANNDTLTLFPGFTSPTTFDGGTNTNTVIFDGTSTADNIAITSTKVSSAVSSLTYSNISSLTVDGQAGDDVITISGAPASTITTAIKGGDGNDTLNVNAALASSGSTTTFAGGTLSTDHDVLNVNAGTFQFTGDPQSTTPHLTANVASALVFNASTGTTLVQRNLEALNVQSTGVVTVNNPTNHSGRAILILASFTMTSGGRLDLGGNDMIVHNGDINAISSLILTGFANGAWNGPGISSSAAHSDTKFVTCIGAILNSGGSGAIYGTGAPFGTFEGQTTVATDVLIKYTYYGDADLSGQVNGTDYSLIDGGFNNHLTGWFNGDFNFDGAVNGSDYSLIDGGFNNQGSQL